MENELAINYARALFELSKPEYYQAYLSAWDEFLSSLEDKEWARFLESYTVDLTQKYGALDKVYSFQDAPELLPLLKVMISHHRNNLFKDVASLYRGYVHESLGIKEGILFSAYPLSEKEVKRVEEAIAKQLGGRVYLIQKVDHTLLGGIKVNIDGKVYDGTLRNRLQELKRRLKGGAS